MVCCFAVILAAAVAAAAVAADDDDVVVHICSIIELFVLCERLVYITVGAGVAVALFEHRRERFTKKKYSK